MISELLTLMISMVIGAAFVLIDYGYSGSYRDFWARGDGRGLGAAFLTPAIAALVVIPLGASDGAYIRFVAPIGPSLLVGAALFGVGMQVANGCGSGTLVAAGRGSGRMWVTLPFFCLGGVVGSLILPAAERLPGLGPIDLPGSLGIWPGLLATEVVLLASAQAFLRRGRPTRRQWLAAGLVGALAAGLFLVSGEPWGITMGLTLFGANAVQALGGDLGGTEFWAGGWQGVALNGPIGTFTSALTDIGLLLGALLAAVASGRSLLGAPLGWRGAVGAALGGVFMGVGARLAYGCNIGAFVSGLSSGSLHGLVWIVAALGGSWVGMRLRPAFGLDFEQRPGAGPV